jgi:DNA-binding IclR family transcriptional regulator
MLRQSMRVLELFSATRREIGVMDVAALLSVPKSTASRWLSGMAGAGFLDRDPMSSRYRLSLRLGSLGDLARESTNLHRLALIDLQWLATTTEETANLAVLAGGESLNVAAVESPRPIIQTGWVGRRLPCHATATGKSLLAWRSSAEVKRLLPKRLPKFTSRTITDVTLLLAELGRVRARGFSVAWGELEDDLAAVAAPVRDHAGTIVGAIAIGGPVSRIPRHRLAEYRDPVVQAARMLSERLGWHPAP